MLTNKQKENFLICDRYCKLTDFEMSIKNGDIELFNCYLEEMSHINFCHLTRDGESLINLSLKQASINKNYTIPEIILNHKSFDITKEHRDPISIACLLNDFYLLKLFINKGFNINKNIDNYLTILLSKGVIQENIEHNFLNMAFFFVNKYSEFHHDCLFLFYIISLKQYIKRSKSLYSDEYFKYLNDKSDAIFVQIVKKNGYNRDTTIAEKDFQKNIVAYLIQEREYKMLSYILKNNPEDIYYYVKNQKYYSIFYAIKEMDMFLFKWLLSNTKIKDIKNDNGILPLSFVINIMEENHNKKIIKQIYNKRNDILEEMFTSLINEGFSCHSSFREFSSAYSLLLLTQDINKELKFRLLEKVKQSINFDVNKIDSDKETVFSLIYTNNDYDDIFEWLNKNNAEVNFNNISSINKVIPRQYNLDRLISILNIDDPNEYHKINNETIYHTLMKSRHNNIHIFLNTLYNYGYDILSLNKDNENCIEYSKNKGLTNLFLNCLNSFYQNEYLKKIMENKIKAAKNQNICITRI